MSKTNTFENDVVKLIFNGTPIANIADNAASGPLASLYLSLHSADPGEAGVQNTSEVTYPGYARVAVPRNSGGFTVTGNEAALAANTDFPVGTAGTAGSPATHWGVGVASSGGTKLLYSGALDNTIVVGVGVVPRLLAGTKVTED